jgi:hypothetical protein
MLSEELGKTRERGTTFVASGFTSGASKYDFYYIYTISYKPHSLIKGFEDGAMSSTSHFPAFREIALVTALFEQI